jgi:hypothetical protein
MEWAICIFWSCFVSYIIGVIVGECKTDHYWREKWWELLEKYISEYPESFDDDPEDEEDESTRD